MLRTIWVAIAAIVVTIPFATAVMFVAFVRSNAAIIDSLIRVWARSLVRLAGIALRTERMETVDRKQRYILVSNHYSYFDIPVIIAAVPQPIRFMAKVSLFKIPIFGCAGFIPIDRKNRRTAVKSFDLAAERIRKGNTIVVFPEEGRSRNREMRPFQRGGVLLGREAGLPVLP